MLVVVSEVKLSYETGLLTDSTTARDFITERFMAVTRKRAQGDGGTVRHEAAR